MATQTWLGNAAPVAQITALTPATPSVGDTFTVTCNSKSVSYVTTPGTVADVCNGLATAIQNSTYAEFGEFTATNMSGATIQLAGRTAGLPFSVTLSVTTSGSATFTQSTTTSATGPNDWSNGANWSTGSAPANSDNVYISTGSVPILYGVAQSGVTLTSLNISQAYTGTIGLPTTNSKGYREYRTLELQIGVTTLNQGQGTTGSGSGRIKINGGSVQTTLNVYNTGQPADAGNPAFIWHGTNASNVVNINKGNVGIAFFPGDTATVATLRTGYVAQVNSDVTLTCGAGLTLTTMLADGGTTTLNSAATTLTVYAGTVSVWGSGAVTTVNAYGSVYWNSTGTLTTLNVWGTFDVSQDQQAKAITNTIQLYEGAVLNDPYKVIGSMVYKVNGDPGTVKANIGQSVTITRS